MSKTNEGLAVHAEKQLGLPYWYGTFGAKANVPLWQQKRKQYPRHYSDSRYKTAKAKHFGKRTYDCAGLVKSYMFMDTPTSSPKYDVKYDKNVGGLISACTETGSISTMPETVGILVFRKKSHVGIYIGNGYVIEAKGFDYGVVKTKLTAGNWDKWGKLGWIEYVAKPKEKPKKGDYEMKKFVNTSGKTLNVYADSHLKKKIGALYKGSECNCIGEVDGKAILLYKVIAKGISKVGFTDYVKGIK